MTALPGTWVARDAGGNGTTPRASRLAQAGLLAKNSDGSVRVGVLADGQGPVVTGTAGMSYSVRKHVAVTKMSEVNGPVLVPNDGPVSVSTTPAPGSNSRIDVVYVLQRHVTGDGGSESTNAPVIGVVQGGAASVPSAPSIPTGATELGRATVTSGTTATSALTITPGRWTAPTGSAIPVADGTERDSITPYEGLRVYRLDKHRVETYLGSTGWDQVDPTALTPFGAGWSNVAEGCAYGRDGKMGFLYIAAQKATFAAGEGIVAVPSSQLPARVARIVGQFNGAIRTATLNTDGTVTADVGSGGIVGHIAYQIA